MTIKSLSPKRQEICLVGEHPCGAPASPYDLAIVPRGVVLPREGRKDPPLQDEPSDVINANSRDLSELGREVTSLWYSMELRKFVCKRGRRGVLVHSPWGCSSPLLKSGCQWVVGYPPLPASGVVLRARTDLLRLNLHTQGPLPTALALWVVGLQVARSRHGKLPLRQANEGER